MHEKDDAEVSTDRKRPCLHCLIRETIDEYAEHMHKVTGSPVNIHDTIKDLLAMSAN